MRLAIIYTLCVLAAAGCIAMGWQMLQAIG